MDNKDLKILIVDDEPDILEIVGYNLTKEGFKVTTASNGKEALKKAKKNIPHLIILDVMMPEMDGIETCEKLRANEKLNNTIITFFTARNEDYSQIAGLEAGADDYITKPVKPKVLIGKVNSLLRRIFMSSSELKDVLDFGNIIINRKEYFVELNGKKIVLPRKEFELLYLLASEPKKVFKRDVIMNTVWGNEVVVGNRTIDVHVRKLREKIGDNYIQTTKGIGYKFVNV